MKQLGRVSLRRVHGRVAGALRGQTRGILLASLPLFVLGCEGCTYGLNRTALPADATPEEIALAGASVLIGTGDIAECGNEGDENTARLVDSVLKVNAAANVPTVVFTLGDHAYPYASERNLRRCFTPSWGDPRKGIMKAIRPSMGNHDWQSGRGDPYYVYFGERAGPRGLGYYSYGLGDWHVVVLNSELAAEGNASEKRAQEAWLRQDLQVNRKKCTVAYFHRPLFSSAFRRGSQEVRDIWTILYENDVDLVLSGHDHHYERSYPMSPAGVVDSVRGMEQILVGTGGATLRGFRSRFGFGGPPAAPHAVTQIQGHFGVLKLTLGPDEYRSVFISSSGAVWDPAGRKCH